MEKEGFKKGDKVRIAQNYSHHTFKIGDIVTLVSEKMMEMGMDYYYCTLGNKFSYVFIDEMESISKLELSRINAEENYPSTPLSVLRYIDDLEGELREINKLVEEVEEIKNRADTPLINPDVEYLRDKLFASLKVPKPTTTTDNIITTDGSVTTTITTTTTTTTTTTEGNKPTTTGENLMDNYINLDWGKYFGGNNRP